jgi:hypothetical protein
MPYWIKMPQLDLFFQDAFLWAGLICAKLPWF